MTQLEVGKKYAGFGRAFKVDYINGQWAEVRWLNGQLPRRGADRYVYRRDWHLYKLLPAQNPKLFQRDKTARTNPEENVTI